MYKVPPSYYLKQALKANDYNTWVNMTFAFFRTSAVHTYFLLDGYAKAYNELFKNMSAVAQQRES